MPQKTLSHSKSIWCRDLQQRACPLCGGEENRVLSRKMQHGLDLTTVICRNCALVFTNPMPGEELYQRYYREAYAHFYGAIAAKLDVTPGGSEPGKVTHRLDYIEAHQKLRGSRLLELGPGGGSFLWWARQRGAEVLGVEPADDFYQVLAGAGLPCLHGTLETVAPQQTGKFDIIAMFHVLEHFHDPNFALQQCRALLRDDGIVVIEVPNILKPFRSLDRYFLRYVHLTNFSPHTLEALLEKHGFETLERNEGTSDWRLPRHLFVVARKKQQMPEKFPMPRQSDMEVLAILRHYRRQWLWPRALQWHIWQRLKQSPALLNKMRSLKHQLHTRLKPG